MGSEASLESDEVEDISSVKSEVDTPVSIDNLGYMALFWIYILFQAVFGVLKYGPYSDNCEIFSDDFDVNCPTFILYPIQLGIYTILIIGTVACKCKQKRSIWEEMCPDKCCSCDQLLFPIVILIFMGFCQLFIGIFYQHYYFFQLFIDMFGYTLWFLYAPIFAEALKTCSNKFLTSNKTRKYYMTHFCFIFITFFAIIWLLITMFGEDFQFDIFLEPLFAHKHDLYCRLALHHHQF